MRLNQRTATTGSYPRTTTAVGDCRKVLPFLAMAFIASAGSAEKPAKDPKLSPEQVLPNPYVDLYKGYKPSFLHKDAYNRYMNLMSGSWRPSAKQMKISSETSFFTLNLIIKNARAEALVDAAIQKEKEKQYREAIKMYQIVIDKYPNAMYRVSKFGVYVPVAQYCQRRLLNFPPEGLKFYRTLYDAKAKEAYEQATRQYSLLGLSEIVDKMLATSYGDNALLALGNAALDRGHHLAALELFTTLRDYFPDSELRTEALDLRIQYCAKLLGRKAPPASGKRAKEELDPAALKRLKQVVQAAKSEKPPFNSQRVSAPHYGADDYHLFPPTVDPLSLEKPVWRMDLPGSRRDHFVFTQPVVTDNSVVYRHKNIVYSRSILNGEVRWKSDLGGRAVWQNGRERQFPGEGLLAQNGLIFTCVYKGGASLVALDEVTGQLKWAYGPMVASTEEEARMRFEATPAGGPRTVYAGYVLDNVEGETHTDTEYGVMAFDSTSGRVRWRQKLCRMQPGKFSSGFAEYRRIRIRSFTSPPLYHQGTVYYNTNAGVVAAMDGASGRIKWLMRYPYHPELHDATRPPPGGYLRLNSLWYPQRPLVIGERLIALTVDSAHMLCLDRQTGKTLWSKTKGFDTHYKGRWTDGGRVYFVGQNAKGELVTVYSGRTYVVRLTDLKTGKDVWESGDIVKLDDQPVMKYAEKVGQYDLAGFAINKKNYNTCARPLMTSDNMLYVPMYTRFYIYRYMPWADIYHLAQIDMTKRKIVEQRRFYTGALQATASRFIYSMAPKMAKAVEKYVKKNDKKGQLKLKHLREIAADHVPENRYGPFMPASRLTFRRFDLPFELRFAPRYVEMIYDRKAVQKKLAKGKDPTSVFAKAELAVADHRLTEAAGLLKTCLKTISSEDLDFRAAVNQVLYQVHKRLARAAVRGGDLESELQNVLGMSRTAGTLAEEIETLFALAEAYERRGEHASASRSFRSIINTYGHHEYPIAGLLGLDRQKTMGAARKIMERAGKYVDPQLFRDEFSRSLALLKKGLPLYFSTVTPLGKSLTVRAGDWASQGLLRLRAGSGGFAKSFERVAGGALNGRPEEEQLFKLWQFPGTASAQKALEGLFESAVKQGGAAGRKRLWQLADAARVCRLKVPEAHRTRVTPPTIDGKEPALAVPFDAKKKDYADARDANWLVLERRGDRRIDPNRLFMGARIKKKLDNKFVLVCQDVVSGEILWKATRKGPAGVSEYIRLKGTGNEPGFTQAFVHGDVVVVHGIYDVLGFGLKDGKQRWHYRVPFDFEIQHAVMSGDMFVLAAPTETVALYIPTDNPAGEVAWQVQEQGDIYLPPYFQGDRLILPRKMPFNVTTRYRATGKMIGRLELPSLSRNTDHPLFEPGDWQPRALPAARDGDLLIVTDGWYYIAIDTGKLAIRWKRLLAHSDTSRDPAMRMAVKGSYLAVVKEDYDQKAIYMFSSKTGQLLWRNDIKNPKSPKPLYSMLIEGKTLYGLEMHPGQGFYFVSRDAATGKTLRRREFKGYQDRPRVTLLKHRFGKHLVARVGDRQDFELKVLDPEKKKGEATHTLRQKGVGPFGVHGRVSATVQNGRLVLLSKHTLMH